MKDELLSGRARPVLLRVSELGELIAIAMVGTTESGTAFSRAASPRIMKCLPTEVGQACHAFGAIVTLDYMAWCHANKAVEQWTPPLGGLHLGQWIDLDGQNDEAVAHAAVTLCALYADPPYQTAEESSAVVVPRTSEESRFLELVRNEVVRRRPGLKGGFRKAFSLTGKEVGGEIDFVGSHYATCYSAINPKGKAVLRVQTASAALWRLARARDAFGFAAPSAFELTAWIPPKGQPIFSDRDYQVVEETVAELTAEAKREDLGVFTATDPAVACERLIGLEKQYDAMS
jgi:hypothetical protein